MSFIFDDTELISKLTMVVEGQAIVPDNTNLAKYLVSRLSAEYSGQPEISSNTNTPVNINVQHLRSMDALLKFLYDNAVDVDGTRVVYSEAEGNKLPEEQRESLNLGLYSPLLERVESTGKFETTNYWININALTKYVGYLQNLSQSRHYGQEGGNKVLEVMIGKLINEINKVNPSSGLVSKPKSEPGKPKELPDDTVIDTFGSKIISTINPSDDSQGAIQLLAKDLRSMESLNAWLLKAPTAQIITREGNQLKTTKYEQGAQVNPCAILQALYQRARAKISASEEDTKKKNYYIQKLEEIGPKFTGPDGKSCQLTGVGITSPGATGVPGKPGEGKPGVSTSGEISSQDMVNLKSLLGALPFGTNDVSLNRIWIFIDTAGKATQPKDESQFISARNRVEELIRYIRSNLAADKQRADSFELTSDPIMFSHQAAIPASTSYVSLIDALSQIITSTINILRVFSNKYKQEAPAYSEVFSRHIGVGNDNLSDLIQLKGKASYVINPTLKR